MFFKSKLFRFIILLHHIVLASYVQDSNAIYTVLFDHLMVRTLDSEREPPSHTP